MTVLWGKRRATLRLPWAAERGEWAKRLAVGEGPGGPFGGNAAGSASVYRLEVEQLGAVWRQIQVKALVLQVIP
jgi:hypothetical protein